MIQFSVEIEFTEISNLRSTASFAAFEGLREFCFSSALVTTANGRLGGGTLT